MRSGRGVPRLAPVLALLLAGASAAPGRAPLSREEALRLAFGDSLRIETRTAFLTEEEVRAVREAARAPFDARRVTCQVGIAPEDPSGDAERAGADPAEAAGQVRLYAWFDTHVVRTMTETVMVVVAPSGEIRRVEIVAFHEPDDYLPSRRWLDLLGGRRPGQETMPGRDLPNLSGATLTARSVAAAVRKAQALVGILERRAAGGVVNGAGGPP